MRKSRIILAAICLLAAAGGALAAKARLTTYWIETSPGIYTTVDSDVQCPGGSFNCTTKIGIKTYTFYLLQGDPLTYVTQKKLS